MTHFNYAPGVYRSRTDDDAGGHGSCVASKAMGSINGVAKSSSLHVVKSTLSVLDLSWAMNDILEKVTNPLRADYKTRSVVTLAISSNRPYFTGMEDIQPWKQMYKDLKELIDNDIVVVVPSGNYKTRAARIDTLPALWSLPHRPPQNPALDLVIAGAVDVDGQPSYFSQGDAEATVWSTGVDVTCARAFGQTDVVKSGTSYAVGMVSRVKPWIKRRLTRIGHRNHSLLLAVCKPTVCRW